MKLRDERTRIAWRSTVVLAATVGLMGCSLALTPSSAGAYSYVVSVCGYDSGAAMPFTANDYVNVASEEDCNGQTKDLDGMNVWSAVGAVPKGHAGGYWFHAPSGTAITHLAFSGDFSSWDGWSSHWSTQTNGSDYLGDVCESYTDGCNQGLVYGTGTQSVSVDDASEVGFGIWCRASSCAFHDNNSMFGSAGQANVYSAQITVNEPNAPTVSGGGTVWGQSGHWVSGVANSWTLGYSGSDPAGVCQLEPEILNSSGAVVQDSTASNTSPNFSAAAPCGASGRSGSWSPSLVSLANGSYTVRVVSNNPSDWQTGEPGASASVPVSVDNQAPPPVADLNATSPGMGPSGWSASPAFTLSWTGQPDYSGPQAPITTTNVSVAGVSSAQQSASQTTADVETGAAAGGYSASVWEQDEAGNQAGPQSVALYYDPSAPSAPSFGPDRPGWIGSSQADVAETLSATAGGPSGVYGYAVSVDGTPSTDWHEANVTADSAGNASYPIAGLSDGSHQLCAVAFSGAGVAGPQACTTIRIDRQAPATAITTDTPEAQTSWVGHPVTLTATCSDQASLSGCQSVSYQLDGGAVQSADGSSVSVTISSSGAHTLRAWSTDVAGNAGLAVSQQALVDVAAPSGFFEPQQTSDPQQLQVAVAEPFSGVAGGQIQLQLHGSWTSLPTSFSGGVLSALAQDDQLPDGTWAVRALVWNAVGNEAMITGYANGVAVTHTVPARVQTMLRVGETQAARMACAASIARTAARRAEGRRARNQRFTAQLTRVCQSVRRPARTQLSLSRPRAVVVHGLLQTDAGRPVPGARVQVSFTAPGWTPKRLGGAVTDGRGRFRFRLPAGGSGQASFSFPGTLVLGDASRSMTMVVRGEIIAHVARRPVDRHGQSILRVHGRLVGGYVPPGGVQIQPEYIELGQPAAAWAPFGSPIYTDRHGAWQRNIPISPAAAGHTYKLRYVVNKQAEWPFDATTSKVYKRRL